MGYIGVISYNPLILTIDPNFRSGTSKSSFQLRVWSLIFGDGSLSTVIHRSPIVYQGIVGSIFLVGGFKPVERY